MDESGSGWCLGCLRTLDEIAAWSGLSDEGKQRVWTLLPERRAQLALARAEARLDALPVAKPRGSRP